LFVLLGAEFEQMRVFFYQIETSKKISLIHLLPLTPHRLEVLMREEGRFLERLSPQLLPIPDEPLHLSHIRRKEKRGFGGDCYPAGGESRAGRERKEVSICFYVESVSRALEVDEENFEMGLMKGLSSSQYEVGAGGGEATQHVSDLFLPD